MVQIGILTISDRASRGVYEDKSGPAIQAWLERVVASPWTPVYRIVSDGRKEVAESLVALCDQDKVDLVLTTGGTGPAPRDETPEAMAAVLEKELMGFGELMRRISLEQTPTAILSRQTAGTRGRTLIVNLPGKPSSIDISLKAVFPAIPYCLDLIGAGRIETNPSELVAFRPA
ncbi:molybdopterin adenylyltransferase [Consotaella salsifontis]|uniref:Molybdopterin adenylyltransferase n=1 Tax=Consotaella salsifontis TaxID=1365950 RepID=A0A1T4T341_9HYPH|nr:molybdopterin adenylyltransferase [Consotaella salsifontis]SKA34905.1 molybdopterin adenylyltransferase [Consotaella salsifontis]